MRNRSLRLFPWLRHSPTVQRGGARGTRGPRRPARRADTRALLLGLLAGFLLPAADVTVSAIVPAQLFPTGGEVACNPAGTACVWATNQYSASYSPSEIAGCIGGYSGGVFQCTQPVTCLTCGLDNTLFPGYIPPPAVTKGQPFFENTTGNYLLVWVSAYHVTGGSCASATPGSGTCGDTWIVPISTSPLSLSNTVSNPTVKLTNVVSAVNGVLYAQTGGNYIWLSYRAGAAGADHSCTLGAYSIRVWGPYSITGSGFNPGSEISGSPFTPLGTCSYTEMSGFYDAASGEMTFQGVPTGALNYYWQNNIYGFNPLTGALDELVPWGMSLGLYAWNEHANTDATNSLIVWSNSVGATATTYDGSATCFGTGPGCTGNLPLDKWATAIPRWTDASGHVRLGRISTAYQVTGFNVTGSPERAMTCALDGGRPTGTVFSGGYGDYTQPNVLTYMVKDTSGNTGLYSMSFLTFTSRLVGTAGLSGVAELK